MSRSIVAALFAAVLGVGPAIAADMPVKAAVTKVPVVAPLFDWSGWYVGAHVGYGWGDKHWTLVGATVPLTDHWVDGFLGGVQLGFDRQFGNMLIGVQGDLSWSGIDGSGAGFVDPGELFEVRVKRMATLTARLGYVQNRSLFYVKGGAAWAWERYRFSDGGVLEAEWNERRSGWTVGAGFEHAIADNWSASIEYNYIDFGTKTLSFFNVDFYPVEQTMHTVKFGLNYRFATGKAPAPVVTRY